MTILTSSGLTDPLPRSLTDRSRLMAFMIPSPFPFQRAPASVAVRKDDVSAAIHAAMANVAGLGSISGCGGLIQTTSG